MFWCVSFVPRLLVVFCCSGWSSCTDTGSQSACACSHHIQVDKHAQALLWEATTGLSAISLLSSSSSSLSRCPVAFTHPKRVTHSFDMFNPGVFFGYRLVNVQFGSIHPHKNSLVSIVDQFQLQTFHVDNLVELSTKGWMLSTLKERFSPTPGDANAMALFKVG